MFTKDLCSYENFNTQKLSFHLYSHTLDKEKRKYVLRLTDNYFTEWHQFIQSTKLLRCLKNSLILIVIYQLLNINNYVF